MANEKMIIKFNEGENITEKSFSLVPPNEELIMVAVNSNTIQKTERILISGNLQEIYDINLNSNASDYMLFFETLWESLRKLDCGTIKEISFYKDDNLYYTTTKPVAKITYDINIFSKRVTIQIDQIRGFNADLGGEEN